MRYVLLSYTAEKYQALNSGGFTYQLKIRVGRIFKKIKTIPYTIPEHESVVTYFEHWDELIKNETVNKD